MNEIEKQHIESLMSKYHEDFKLIGKHPLAEYKKPTNLYQNILNSICVSKLIRRNTQLLNTPCPTEKEHNILKLSNYPSHKIEEIVKKAVQNCNEGVKTEKSQNPLT